MTGEGLFVFSLKTESVMPICFADFSSWNKLLVLQILYKNHDIRHSLHKLESLRIHKSMRPDELLSEWYLYRWLHLHAYVSGHSILHSIV